MRIRRYIRIIVALLMLLMYGAGDAWALDENNILIQVIPSGKEGKGSVTATEGSVSASVSERMVTLTVTPNDGYKTKKALIIAEKMVDPNRSLARRRASLSGTFEVTASTDGWVTAATTYTFTIPAEYDGAYVTVTFVSTTSNQITSLSDITDLTADYELVQDIDASGFPLNSSDLSVLGTFSGTLNGNFHKIYNLSKPLFSIVNDGTVKNVILEDVNITSGDADGDAGAFCSKAKGSARIYNCGIIPSYTEYDEEGNIKGFTGSSVSGSGNVGGLVGKLEGTARVINCYSYANIESGNIVGGIVGNNTVATASNNLGTMIMNCMFYGDITGGTSKAPIYNGTIISNVGANGVSNFNYFWGEASYVQNRNINVYNCALMAETRFLQRFEFFRHILNGQRELAAWWVKGNDGQRNDMAKWVLEPSQIGSVIPFPILKTPGYYPSVVNIDADNAETIDANNEHRNEGRKLTNMGINGTLAVTIQMGTQGSAPFGKPDGARIKTGKTFPIYLNITDKDTLHYNFNYGKVQLPYYNDYCDGNYTDNRVVTGWKIVSITGGTSGTLATGSDVTFDGSGNISTMPYNFADRNCTNKDLYSVSGRIFNQGAYFDVPEDVTAIVIEPYWAKAAYVSDPNRDKVYTTAMTTTSYNVPNVGGGQRYTNDNNYSINGSSQKVYTSIGSAVTALSITTSNTVYDYAVVLVGNYHQYSAGNIGDDNPYTVTSIDLDGDNEPDYSFMFHLSGRRAFHPVRYDFLNMVGLGMAQKSTGGNGSYNLGIIQPKNWFEVTNTALFRVTQFEYSPTSRPTGNGKKPIILQGGVIEQWVSLQANPGDRVLYFHVGGNVWFKEFHMGTHQDGNNATPHPPVSVTGGDYDYFYLTGAYRADANHYDDNAEGYVNGGRFGVMAGAGMEGIGHATNHTNGNITWLIDHADIREFYGGGINAAHPAQGNIYTIIKNSRVQQFCGGPKFGDMIKTNTITRTVKTIATNCTFGTFYGAGYGGNSYNRYAPFNYTSIKENSTLGFGNIDWNKWVNGEAKADNSKDPGYEGYQQHYSSTYDGVSTQIDYQFLPMSDNASNVARLWIEYVKFSLATTRDVTSTLTGCTIMNNFYGGGNLGKVDGPVTSTLTDCTVHGSVFGAGFSATLPTVEVMNTGGFPKPPRYDANLGVYMSPTWPGTVTYTWEHKDEVNSTATAINTTSHILYTTEDLTTLGTVTGNATLTINGSTTVGGSVYGGGEESGVDGDTEVNVTSGTIGEEGQGGVEFGNVYGGGKGKRDKVSAGLVKGSTKVMISEADSEKPTTVYHNVYGGGAYGSVGNYAYYSSTSEYTTLYNKYKEGGSEPNATKLAALIVKGDSITGYTSGGNTEVYITGGTFGWNGKENGMVFGSSRGDVGAPGSIEDRMAWVYDTRVVIGDTTANATVTTLKPIVKGSVYGGGENGHNFRNSYVRINGGTIGIADGVKVTSNDKEYSGAAYPYRGNIYGGGCGTDMYYSNPTSVANPYDGNGDLYNPLGGIVKGTATVNITAGHIVRNVYGAGAMGSVGNREDVNSGKTTISISGGTIGVNGTDETGDGNVYGAARGDLAAGAGCAEVRETGVTISKGTIKGNVYGGGEAGNVKENVMVNISGGTVNGNVYGGGNLGYVGTFTISADSRDYTWQEVNGHRTGVCRVSVSGGTIGSENSSKGKVFGGSKGLYDTFQCEKAMVDSTNVCVTDGTVYGSVYGGGEIARVERHTSVTIGDEGANGEGNAPVIMGNVFGAGAGVDTHGYSALVRGNTNVLVQGIAKVGKSVYGGGEIASVGKYYLDDDNMPYSLVDDGLGICMVTIQDHAVIGSDGNGGNVFGGGEGITPVYDGTNQRMTLINGKSDWETFGSEELYLKYVETLALATQTYVSVEGNASVKGSVYGGSESGFVQHHTDVTIQDNCQIGTASAGGNVFGGGLGLVSFVDAGRVSGNTTLHIDGGTMFGSVYGGGQAGIVKQNTSVLLEGGTVNHDAYGGGLAANVEGNTSVVLNETVNDANRGCVVSRIFGCNDVSGTPKGTVTVHVHKTQRDGASRITNPTEVPTDEGYVMPKVLGTVIGNNDFDFTTFDVQAVYGGGNLAAYEPTDAATGKTNVIIDGCQRTSIGQVYGGGNAASTPATQVTVKGTFEIGEVFGGGNGKDSIVVNNVKKANPGANVGFRDYSATEDTPGVTPEQLAAAKAAAEYGSGEAHVNIQGGKIHAVFGGSNTKGNVREIAIAMLESEESDPDYCRFDVDEAYGGGKSADMDGEAHLEMKCIPGLTAVYGGAQDADVNNDVVLNITNGTFDQVFGGNNIGGRIMGSITVNIEETGCRPIIIGELYGGGNRAAYSVYGYKQVTQGEGDEAVTTWKICESATEAPTGFMKYDDPVVNVKSFTSIGSIYGGGYGASATMVGSPTVNISVVEDDTTPAQTHDDAEFAGVTKDIDGDEVTMPEHEQGKMGVISQVFGGGNAAKVIGDTNVNIGTLGTVDYVTKFSGESEVRTGLVVKGVDIRGNIYGGGNQAEVTGKTNVTIGQ